ncbi:Cell division protein FtsI (modular protein) [Sulfurovum sp. enrichment culture clone C5]|uniref:Cell division protein FtsI (Modular protein) n=1 Tax=Sulfurovum sp. enrichment culture clone C5 TaxID=497650 RepID=A0A0S4XM70_9BACT|nr:Cell division protein FtsI (modular protein) [Sulfurovum sp. enrichment culture clone C5]
MNQDTNNHYYSQKNTKILFLFLLFVLAFAIFLFSTLRTIFSDRDLPSHTSTINDRSIRGEIISKDNYTVSKSQKIYQVGIRSESINPDNKELFISLFSLYSDIPKKEVRNKFKDKHGFEIKSGNIILSKTIDARHAAQLKSLKSKLRNLNILKPIKKENGIEIVYGLDVVEIGENRVFPLKDTLSPILGYVGKQIEKEYIRPDGMQGLERKYDKYIKFKQNGIIEGKRDVVGDVIHNQFSKIDQRVDGMNLHLTIPLKLQRNVELMLDDMKIETNSDEILATVIDSKTGEILVMASSNRYDPNLITKESINSLNPKFSEYLYEPGSVLKPLTLAIALELGRVTPDAVFNLFNGELDIGGKHKITDGEHRFPALSAEDIIIHSSNVGISLISWRLSGKEFHDGLVKFGLSRPSGIDLSRDFPGSIRSIPQLNQKIYRANSSYGYGLMASFIQLVKAYTAFDNDGIIPTPHMIDFLEDSEGKKYKLANQNQKTKVISSKTALQMKNILIKTVENGTGAQAKTAGIIVGGKTGTAKMISSGQYTQNSFRTSFIGFANDEYGHKYTIGVLVINPNRPFPYYYASATAVPTTKKIIDMLVILNYLKPNKSAITLQQTDKNITLTEVDN